MTALLLVWLWTVPEVRAVQAGAPALPALTLESYPEEARAAIAAAYESARREPQDAAAAGRLGMVLQAWDQWDAAHRAYVRARHLAPDTFDWHYLDGIVLQRLARPGDAAARFERAVQLRPGSLPARLKLAESRLDAGEHDQSAAVFGSLQDEPAAGPAVAFGLGRLAAAAGRHGEAVEQFRRATNLFPEFGAAWYAMAQSLRALGRRDEASKALREHQQHGPAWPGLEDPWLADVAALRDDARTALKRALQQARSGDVAGAIAAHEAALAREPDLAQAHANLVILAARAGDWPKVEKHYRAVLNLGFNLDEAHYNYGVGLGLQGRYEEAEAAYRAALAVNPQHADAHNNLGQLLERQGKLEEALSHYGAAVRANPAFRLARFNLARMLLASKRPAEAARELEQVREPRDAEAPQYLFGLSVAYAQLGKRDEALALARDARSLALEHGQDQLAAAIERDLARLQ